MRRDRGAHHSIKKWNVWRFHPCLHSLNGGTLALWQAKLGHLSSCLLNLRSWHFDSGLSCALLNALFGSILPSLDGWFQNLRGGTVSDAVSSRGISWVTSPSFACRTGMSTTGSPHDALRGLLLDKRPGHLGNWLLDLRHVRAWVAGTWSRRPPPSRGHQYATSRTLPAAGGNAAAGPAPLRAPSLPLRA